MEFIPQLSNEDLSNLLEIKIDKFYVEDTHINYYSGKKYIDGQYHSVGELSFTPELSNYESASIEEVIICSRCGRLDHKEQITSSHRGNFCSDCLNDIVEEDINPL